MGNFNKVIQVNSIPLSPETDAIYLADHRMTSCYAYDQWSFVQSPGTYALIEGYNGGAGGTVSFGIVYLDPDATSSNPLVLTGVNVTSTTMTTNQAVRIQMYHQGDGMWMVRVYTGTSTNPTTTSSTYSLIFRRVNI